MKTKSTLFKCGCGKAYVPTLDKCPGCGKPKWKQERQDTSDRIYLEQKEKEPAGPPVRCPNCGFKGRAGRAPMKGAAGVEITLWIIGIMTVFAVVFVIVAIVYSVWRRSGLEPACPQCGWNRLAPLNAGP